MVRLGSIILGVCLALLCVYAYRQSIPGHTYALSGIVIPHHDMVSEAREAFLMEIGKEMNPDTLIVVSPDHFEHARAPMVTTDRIWKLRDGVIEPDSECILGSALPVEDRPFRDEHGITSIVAPLHRAFPYARIVPILVSTRATFDEMTALVDRLATQCGRRTLLVASIDFSHSGSRDVAALHDESALRALYTANVLGAYRDAEVDSPGALAAFIAWANLHGTNQFSLFAHTNSGALRNEVVGEMTTHIMGAFRHGDAKSYPRYTFMIGGDTMFARGVETEGVQNPFELLGDRFFWGVDDAIVNLEGVFADHQAQEKRVQAWNQFPPELVFHPRYAPILADARVTGVFHTNNHMYDGDAGEYAYTKALLDHAGIDHIGPDIHDRAGVGVYIPPDSPIPVAYVACNTVRSEAKFLETVTRLSQSYRVIAYMHWGNEYAYEHSEEQERMAHDLVDAGAALVVGSHPHVIQDVEVYRGVPIFYSLGNFLFDQDERESVQQGLVLGGVWSPDALDLFLIPVHTYLTPYPIPHGEAGKVFEGMVHLLEPFAIAPGRYRFPYTND